MGSLPNSVWGKTTPIRMAAPECAEYRRPFSLIIRRSGQVGVTWTADDESRTLHTMNDDVHPSHMAVARIGHIALMTPNLARLTHFYVDIFGGVIASSTGKPPWKCTLQLAPGTL